MSEENQLRQVKRKKKKKTYKLGFNWFFWISFIVICIPCVYFVYLLVSASQVSNTPILGNRIENSITNKIEESQLETIRSEIKGLENVESFEVNLIVETLRITINATDELTVEEYSAIATSAYEVVTKNLEIEKYFAQVDEYKQYDLQITVYDSLDKDNPVIVDLVKNSHMETYKVAVLSQALNQELVDSLTKPVEPENPEDNDEDVYATDTE